MQATSQNVNNKSSETNIIRAYLSNIRPAWTEARQEAELDRGAPGWRDGTAFRDRITLRARKSQSVAALTARVDLLRPTRRRSAERIVVASLAVLAWDQADLMRVLAQLAERGSTLVAVAEGMEIPPVPGADELARVSDALEAACKAAKAAGREVGGRISGERRYAAAEAKCATIRERWALSSREHPTVALCREAGVSRATALAHLGDREKAQHARIVAQANTKRRKVKGGGK